MTFPRWPAIITVLLAGGSCILEPPEGPIDPPPCTFVCSNTNPMGVSQRSRLEGIYLVENGSEILGSTVVVKWNTPGYLSILTDHEVTFLVLQGGHLDSVFFFEGYWRSQNSHRSGRVEFRITKPSGGRWLMGDSSASREFVFEGTATGGSSGSIVPVRFRYLWAIRPEILQEKFWILAHRAGARMSELPPHSENTVELIRIAEHYGANAIEIDVRLTRDHVPVLYHDNTLNPRLVRKTSMLGGVEDYSIAQLRTFIRLINGEQIPTLEEALKAVVTETNLSLVWLDLKTEGSDIVARVVPLLEKYTADAAFLASQGLRDSLDIMVGIPTDAIYDEFVKYPNHVSVPSITERSLDRARVLHSRVWAPLWSGGINVVDNTKAHAEGRKVFVWTLDEPQFVQEYINSGQYDGILSDYPMIVAYYHYVR